VHIQRAIQHLLERDCHGMVVTRSGPMTESRYSSRTEGVVSSLVQTARVNELEPYAYLRRLFAELPVAQTLEQIEALLP